MSGGWWLVIAAVGAAAFAGCLVRVCLGDIWDAIGAVAIFFALFAAGGSSLGRWTEDRLRDWDVIAYDAPRGAVVAAAGLVAAALASALACLTICCLRRLAARLRREPG